MENSYSAACSGLKQLAHDLDGIWLTNEASYTWTRVKRSLRADGQIGGSDCLVPTFGLYRFRDPPVCIFLGWLFQRPHLAQLLHASDMCVGVSFSGAAGAKIGLLTGEGRSGNEPSILQSLLAAF